MRNSLAIMFLGVCVAAPVGAETGQAVYAQQCAKCHDTGLINSPKLGDKPGWAPKLATGVDAMTAAVLKGKGAMPPRGTCPQCSDGDLRAAVEYIASKSR
jgi:cytochrome c5